PLRAMARIPAWPWLPRKHGDRFLLAHFWLPLPVFATALGIATLGHGDQRLADLAYGLEGYAWTLRHAYLTEQVVHVMGRDASATAWRLVLAAWLATFASSRWSQWQRPLAYLLISTLLSASLVAWIKLWSNMDCPWDLLRYGGTHPRVGLFGLRPAGLG